MAGRTVVGFLKKNSMTYFTSLKVTKVIFLAGIALFFHFASASRLNYDLGLSTGKVGEDSYTEANLGLNYYFLEWLAWRNALFARFSSDHEDIWGLDSSARFVFRADLAENTGLTFFGGPGFRFPSRGSSVPFASAGVVAKLGGLSIGGGVKTFFNDWVDEDMEKDTQYFIILSGSGSL